MYSKYIKRILDIILSVMIFPIVLLASIIIIPCIWIEDRGTPFYNAPRLGRYGKFFTMYKFRSMYRNAPDIRNADGTTYNSDGDGRVTRIGKIIRKTSLDELPQILNVLKGNMSLVGPRPDLPDALNAFIGDEEKKLDVRPGITGYSQAYHRNNIELHERFREDVYYAEHVSFMLDVKIVLKTIDSVLLRRNVYRNTMSSTHDETAIGSEEGYYENNKC